MCVCFIIPRAVRRPIVWEAIKGNFPESLVEPHARLNLRAIFLDSVDSLYIFFPYFSPPFFSVSFFLHSVSFTARFYIVKRFVFTSVFIKAPLSHSWYVLFEEATILIL